MNFTGLIWQIPLSGTGYAIIFQSESQKLPSCTTVGWHFSSAPGLGQCVFGQEGPFGADTHRQPAAGGILMGKIKDGDFEAIKPGDSGNLTWVRGNRMLYFTPQIWKHIVGIHGGRVGYGWDINHLWLGEGYNQLSGYFSLLSAWFSGVFLISLEWFDLWSIFGIGSLIMAVAFSFTPVAWFIALVCSCTMVPS